MFIEDLLTLWFGQTPFNIMVWSNVDIHWIPFNIMVWSNVEVHWRPFNILVWSSMVRYYNSIFLILRVALASHK